MTQKFAKFLLTKVLGWKYTPGEDSVIPENRAVLLAAPHTSIWDFAIGYIYYRSVGGHLRTMIKKEAFFFPLGPLLRSMGAFPMDRKNPQQMLMNIMHEMEKAETFHLVICPEGTRKAVSRWKKGYHTIAMHAGVPVYLTHYDYRTRTVGRGQKFILCGDAAEDTRLIQQKYAEMNLTALYPDNFTTG